MFFQLVWFIYCLGNRYTNQKRLSMLCSPPSTVLELSMVHFESWSHYFIYHMTSSTLASGFSNLYSVSDALRNIHSGCLGLVHWDDPVGWCREGGGRGFRMWSTCIPVADSFWCLAKLIQCLRIKNKIKKKNKKKEIFILSNVIGRWMGNNKEF